MRFRGGGVGHKATRNATDEFLSDRHVSEERPSAAKAKARTNETDENEEDENSNIGEEEDVTDELPVGVNEWIDEEDDFGYDFVVEDSEDEVENEADEPDHENAILGGEDSEEVDDANLVEGFASL